MDGMMLAHATVKSHHRVTVKAHLSALFRPIRNVRSRLKKVLDQRNQFGAPFIW